MGIEIIDFKATKCKHCYKCVRYCEVKAIQVKDERAVIMPDKCILCGHCLKICPQSAKTLKSDLDLVKGFIARGDRVVVSIAPAYMGLLKYKTIGQVRSALIRLGFEDVRETSEGAAFVTAEYARLLEEHAMENIITTCCPSFNRLVECYYPDLIDQMAPVISPMIAHARLLKQSFGKQIKVVFAGPCIAKKDEAADIRHNNDVDAVLTFEDLALWFRECPEKIVDAQPASFLNASSKILRMYPVTEGIIASLKAKGDTGDWKMISVSGHEDCISLCRALQRGELNHCFVEVNMCKDACINGPVTVKDETSRFAMKLRIEEYAREDESYPVLDASIPMGMTFVDRSVKEDIPDEETIRAILAKIGKTSPEDELNCGSCGYPTCREKAIAVYQNKAELTMCVPYMKERAESLSNFVLSETPNVTIMVDEEMNIVEFNRAAERTFGITRHEALQKCLYEIMDSSDFQYVFETGESIIDKKVEYPQYGITTMQNLIYIAKEKLVMGIFRDITREIAAQENTYRLRVETMEMAQKVIDKQMVAAQQIASLLGETTAETKVTLTKLKDMIVFDEK